MKRRIKKNNITEGFNNTPEFLGITEQDGKYYLYLNDERGRLIHYEAFNEYKEANKLRNGLDNKVENNDKNKRLDIIDKLQKTKHNIKKKVKKLRRVKNEKNN